MSPNSVAYITASVRSAQTHRNIASACICRYSVTWSTTSLYKTRANILRHAAVTTTIRPRFDARSTEVIKVTVT